MDDTLKRLTELVEAATPGPFSTFSVAQHYIRQDNGGPIAFVCVGQFVDEDQSLRNRDMILAAINLMPLLILLLKQRECKECDRGLIQDYGSRGEPYTIVCDCEREIRAALEGT